MVCNYPLPHEDNVLNLYIQNLERKACSDEKILPVTWSDEKLINSSFYIAPVGDLTHDLPHTVASNMVRVSHSLNHSATEALILILWIGPTC